MAFRGICILFATVDTICCSIVSEMLRGVTFEIIHAGKPLETLNAICERKERIKIIVSNFNRIQSQITSDILYHIKKKLKLETFLMSPDNQIFELTQQNDWCVAYLVDPSSIADVLRFWKMSTIQELSKAIYWTSQISPASSSSSTSNQQPASSVGPRDNVENNEDVVDKKSRVVWNEELDRKFLNAIHTLLSNEKPVLSRIIDLMGVPGLKRKSISSHLQKYNLRVAKKGRYHSTKQMAGFPSLSDGLNPTSSASSGIFPIFWYPTSANTIPRPASIPEQAQPVVNHREANPTSADTIPAIPADETNSEQAQPVANQTPPADTIPRPAAVPEEQAQQRDVDEEANYPTRAEDEDGVSTLIANFWNDPPSLD